MGRKVSQIGEVNTLSNPFQEDPTLLTFAKFLSLLSFRSDLGEFLPAVLYECLTKEKYEVVGTYLAIYDALRGLSSTKKSYSLHGMWNLKLLVAYYRGLTRLRFSFNMQPLIQKVGQ